MKRLFRFTAMLVLLLCMVYSVTAQESFKNTLSYDSTIGSPNATLEELKWVSGHWRGEAFGGITEEIWSPPLGNSMMCAFKLVVNGKVNFYELLTISEEKGTLILRLKHFHGSLKGWEEKDKTIDFKLVKTTPDKIYFNQFTFEKAGTDKLNIYVVFKQKDGTMEEAKFSYNRWRG